MPGGFPDWSPISPRGDFPSMGVEGMPKAIRGLRWIVAIPVRMKTGRTPHSRLLLPGVPSVILTSSIQSKQRSGRPWHFSE